MNTTTARAKSPDSFPEQQIVVTLTPDQAEVIGSAIYQAMKQCPVRSDERSKLQDAFDAFNAAPSLTA